MSLQSQPGTSPPLPENLTQKARDYARRAKAPNTLRAYQADWVAFGGWCSQQNRPALPASPDTVLAYLTAHAGVLKVSTLQRRLSAIREAHRYAQAPLDLTSVVFRDVWTGIRRTHGAPPAKKKALLTPLLRRAVAALPHTLIGIRDRALLLVGFAAALRRHELANLEIIRGNGAAGWIEETADGLIVHLGHAKTDQEAHGVDVGVPYGSSPGTCPVRAWRAWLEASGLKAGPLFRPVNRHGHIGEAAISTHAIARIIKRAIIAVARAEGLSRSEAAARAAEFAGHSLRSGLATSAAANDATGDLIQRHLRHARYETTARYIHAGQLFKRNAASMAGL